MSLRFDYDILPCKGTEAVYAMQDRWPAPVGFIWYRQILTQHVDILYIFVNEHVRRQAIASKMLGWLKNNYEGWTIYTTVANEFSEPWLRAKGFTKEPNGWFLRPPEPEPCPMI